MKKIKLLSLGVALLTSFSGTANATLVTSIPYGIDIAMPVMNYFGGGPITFDSGNITWYSTNVSHQDGSVFGYINEYGFGSNGYWYNNLVMAGVNDNTAFYGVSDTMTFEFDYPVSAVGGLINYFPDMGDSPVISVYDSSYNLIESATLNFSTGEATDSGMFYGFEEGTDSIKYFTLNDAYIGIANLKTNVTIVPIPVPEPSTFVFFGIGGLCMMGMANVKRRKTVDVE
jgi:hypothetical protein